MIMQDHIMSLYNNKNIEIKWEREGGGSSVQSN